MRELALFLYGWGWGSDQGCKTVAARALKINKKAVNRIHQKASVY